MRLRGPLAFRAEGERRCLGVRRGGRRTPCPVGAGVPGRGTRAQCEECARIDRAHSVAADTFADDPRPYHVYLAWFGPGLVKTGITGTARGPARLLEQGAVAFSWLGRGPLMAARRAEELLRAALGVPDRVPYTAKRAVRGALPPAGERAAELAALHRSATGLDGWPEALARLPCEVTDHAEVFGLSALSPGHAEAVELVPGGGVAGTLVAVAGPDLHVRQHTGRTVVVDSRLMSGWRLTAAPDADAASLPVREVAGARQTGLF